MEKGTKDMEAIMDWGLASGNEQKIIKFLDKLYSINVDHPKIWEKEIFDFFSQELIVPYVIRTSIKEEDEEFLELTKKIFFNKVFGNHTLIWDSNNCYKNLIEIKESIKVGTKIKEYLPFLFMNNCIIRRMFVKRTDKEDSRFNNFGASIHPIHCEIKKDEEILGYETVYFLLPDGDVKYPLKEWHKKISKEWRGKLKDKLGGKKKSNSKRKPLDSRLRHECFKRDNYKCLDCGATKEKTILHADHILPVSQGGTDELDNLQTLCENCNLAKSNRHWKGGKDNEEKVSETRR